LIEVFWKGLINREFFGMIAKLIFFVGVATIWTGVDACKLGFDGDFGNWNFKALKFLISKVDNWLD
jgi:hypothetical protein